MRQPVFSCTSSTSAGGVGLVSRRLSRCLGASGPRIPRQPGEGDARKLTRLAWGAVLLAVLSLDPAAATAGGGVSSPGEVQRVAIVGGSYFFRPDHVVVTAGRRVELEVKAEPGIIPHRFVLETAAGVTLADVSLDEQPQVLSLDLPPGKYVFHCPNRLLLFKSHRERGMAGVLEVKE